MKNGKWLGAREQIVLRWKPAFDPNSPRDLAKTGLAIPRIRAKTFPLTRFENLDEFQDALKLAVDRAATFWNEGTHP
jgi:hypothetical protein